MAKRLVATGIVAARQQHTPVPIHSFLDSFVESRRHAKPATKEIWQQPIRNLKAFFGESRDITTITEEDAENFKGYLHDQDLACTTVAKRLQFTRGFFKFAVKRKLLTANPFDDVSEVAVGNPDSKRFVTRDETSALLAVADPTWRVIIALARFGGLRCPSEVASLRWQDIDWEKGVITVTSPKTEHHKGHETRLIPLFPEIEEVLVEARKSLPEGPGYIIGGHLREKALKPSGWRSCSLRPQFNRLIARAGLKPWPRLFHNLRASRETDLVEAFPAHVTAAWMGHSPKVAMKHYTMVRDSHFREAMDRALGGGLPSHTRPTLPCPTASLPYRFAARLDGGPSKQASPGHGCRALPLRCPPGRRALKASKPGPWMAGLALSGGGRIRTCDLEVMSLASYRAAPPHGV